MLRKPWISGFAVGLAAASAGALADNNHDSYRDDEDGRYDRNGGDYDFARVVNAEAIRRQVRISEPVRECWNEVAYDSDGPFSSRHVGSTLLGGLIGGVVGNQVSHERQRGTYDNERLVERCEVRYHDSWDERIDGYRVTYEYAGREYTTRMPYDPGERVRIRVDVTPVRG